LKKLEKQGLIKRERSAEDERNLIVTITEKGEELKEKATEIPEKMGNCMKIQPEDAKALYRTLYGILEQLSE
jgi:DNA-binding MarR family transcriptional regulator